MFNLQETLAKPDGLSLYEHNHDLIKYHHKFFQNNEFIYDKYYKLFKIDLLSLVNDIINGHDIGKGYDWQKACRDDFKLYKENKLLHNIMKAGVRHEFHSVLHNLVYNKENSLIKNISIASHHGKFYISDDGLYHEKLKKHKINNVNFFDDFYIKVFSLIKKQHDNKLNSEMVLLGYKYATPRAILQIVDKFASAIEGVNNKNISIEEKNEEIENLLPKKYSWKIPEHFTKLRPIQKMLSEVDLNFDVYLIRASAGSGKTGGGNILSKRIIEILNCANRTIFAMPTIFTSNEITKEIEGSSVYHSTVKKIKKYCFNDIYSAKTFNSSITVTTVDHLLSTLTHQYEHHFVGSSFIANSVVVFDEIDFYDEFVFQNIKEFIKYYRKLGVKFILMSATFPDKIIEYFSDIEDSKISKPIIDTTYDNYKKFKLLNIKKYDVRNMERDLSHILHNLKKYKGGIIYNNTVATTKLMYEFVKKNGFNSILYNSHFTNEDKIKKEGLIINNFGKNKTLNDFDVAIMSPIGELSINISSDYMVTDICPSDRLGQRFGRLKRFNIGEMGYVDIILPYRNNMKYYFPYQTITEQYGEGEILETLIKTENALLEKVGHEFTNKELMDIVNDSYSGFNEDNFSNESKNNTKNYLDLIKNNLIMSNKKPINSDLSDVLIDEDNRSANWRTRNFMATNQILIHNFNDGEIVSKDNYIDIVNKKTITVHSGFFDLNLREGNIRNINVFIDERKEENKKTISQITNINNYDFERGLNGSFYRVISG
jgi:CRISPR-associated endonuclease/helicase Cas3